MVKSTRGTARGSTIRGRFRRIWKIKPFTRIKKSKKVYDRKKQKIKDKKEINEYKKEKQNGKN